MTPWIKLEVTTPDKPEIVAMAARLRIDQDAVVGKCLRIWAWADQNSVNGHALPITAEFIDRRLTSQKGFAAAMRSVGWLSGDDGALTFPGFSRHNGATAKARAESARRMAKSRDERNESATPAPPPCDGYVAGNAQPKPQPDQSKSKSPERERDNAPARGEPPTEEQARAAAPRFGISEAEAATWWLARQATGWLKSDGGGGQIRIVDWEADLQRFTELERQRRPPSDPSAKPSTSTTKQQKRTDEHQRHQPNPESPTGF